MYRKKKYKNALEGEGDKKLVKVMLVEVLKYSLSQHMSSSFHLRMEQDMFLLVFLIYILDFLGKESKLKLKAQTELSKAHSSSAVDVLVFIG